MTTNSMTGTGNMSDNRSIAQRRAHLRTNWQLFKWTMLCITVGALVSMLVLLNIAHNTPHFRPFEYCVVSVLINIVGWAFGGLTHHLLVRRIDRDELDLSHETMVEELRILAPGVDHDIPEPGHEN